jgi:hypothetical protein
MFPNPAKLLLCLLFWTQGGWALDTVRQQEIAQCLPGEITTWADGVDRPALSSPLMLVYKHAGAPAWFNELQVLGAIQNAALAWSSCGVPSQVSAWFAGQDLHQGEVLVQWSDAGSRQNFGLANLGERTLSLGPAAFQLLQTRNPAFDSRQTLQMVIAHEMGHLYGVMAHSRRCVDVTSYYTNGQGGTCNIRGGSPLQPGVEYRSVLPTACDIARCRAANGMPKLELK